MSEPSMMLPEQMDICVRDLMRVVGMTSTAEEPSLSAGDIVQMCREAHREIMRTRADKVSAEFDRQDEYFTIEDARTAREMPALPFLERMSRTYKERRGTYGASEQKFADIAMAFFPDGLALKSRTSWVRFGLFFQILSKLSRYTRNWEEPHVDSIHDVGPYAGMLEAEDRRHLHRPPFNFKLEDDA